MANEGRDKEQLTSHTPRIHTPPAPRILRPPNTTQILQLFLQIPPKNKCGVGLRGSPPQLGLGSWQVWETGGQARAFVPYSVFPKPFAFSLPGACSTILPQTQCKQERETESQRLVRGPEPHPSSSRFRHCITGLEIQRYLYVSRVEESRDPFLPPSTTPNHELKTPNF